MAQAMVAKGAERIRQIDPARLSVRDATALATLGVKMERLVRGSPTETVTVRGDVDVWGEERVTGKQILGLLRANPRVAELADEMAGLIDFGRE